MSIARYSSAFLLLFIFCSVTSASGVLTRVPLAGDWNPHHYGDEVGFYDPVERSFNLCRQTYEIGTLDCVSFSAILRRSGIPLMGRWSVNDLVERPAIYQPDTGWFFTYRYGDCPPHSCYGYGGLVADTSRNLGVTGATPVAGDWNGSGVDSLALITPNSKKGGSQARFYADGNVLFAKTLAIPHSYGSFKPLAGNWVGTSHAGDSLGLYGVGLTLELYDDLTFLTSVSTQLFNQSFIPFAGNWAGPSDSPALYVPPASNCSNCNRVDYLWIGMHAYGHWLEELPQPTPHLDSRFPDDVGDP